MTWSKSVKSSSHFPTRYKISPFNAPPTHPNEPSRRIGILGGSFDPPHYGHLAIAKAALSGLDLEEVLFLPNNRNPLKQRERGATGDQRLAMIRLLIEGEPKMAVSDIELTRGGLSYAVETLSELQMAQPAKYWFIMGSDALKDLDNWKSPARLLKLCRIAAINRNANRSFTFPSNLPPDFHEQIDVVPMAHHEASSSEIKERILTKKSITTYLPETVINYIRAHKLYEIE